MSRSSSTTPASPPAAVPRVRPRARARAGSRARRGPVALTSAFPPGMVERGRGAILNVASTAAMQPTALLRRLLGRQGVRADVLRGDPSGAARPRCRRSPRCARGPVETDFWQIAGWEVQGGKSFESAVPKPAWISPQDAARAGVEGLDANRRVVVPGLPIRAAMLAARYVPHAFKLPVLERIMRRK